MINHSALVTRKPYLSEKKSAYIRFLKLHLVSCNETGRKTMVLHIIRTFYNTNGILMTYISQ